MSIANQKPMTSKMSFALLRSASVLYLLLSSLSRCILGYFQTLVDDSKCRWCQHRFWQETGQRLMETVWKQDGNMLTDFIIALRIHCHLFLLNDFLQLKQTTHTERGFLRKKNQPNEWDTLAFWQLQEAKASHPNVSGVFFWHRSKTSLGPLSSVFLAKL